MEEDSDESEWEIQEYYSYIKKGDYDKTSIVKWMLNDGYVIGKNMVITGMVITSAPIVVPPLVAFSAMGFAFSVPFGVGFVTYACTNKIMSTLLPIPPSPSPPSLMWEYYTHEYEQEKCQGVESRFELDDSGDDYRQINGDEISYDIDEYDDGDGGGGGEVEDLVTNLDGDEDGDEERYYIGELGNEEDEIGLENAVEEEDNEQMEDLYQGVDIVFEGDDVYGKQGEALLMNVDENVNEGINHAIKNVVDKELEDYSPQKENVVIEDKGNEQMEDIKQGVAFVFELNERGDDYGQQGESSMIDVDENVDEESHPANEHVDAKEMEDHMPRRENVVIEEEENEQMEDIKQVVAIVFELNEGGDDYGQQGQASIINVDESVDEVSHHANENEDEKELEDHVLQRENVFIEEEEKEQMEDIKQGVDVFDLDEGGDDYRKQEEALIMNVDENADERSNHANINVDEKEMEDHVLQRENVFIEKEEKEQKEQMEDIKQGVAIVFELNEDGDDYGKQGEPSIMDVDKNVDEESNHADNNEDEKEMEDHVLQRENVFIEEEETEQMEDIKQGVEMRLGLDESAEDQGYEEDVGEYLEGDDDSFEDEHGPLVKSRIDENTSNTREVTEDEKEEKVEGSSGLLENIRDEGNINNTVEDDYLLDESALVFEDDGDVKIIEPVMVKEIDSEKLIMDGSTNNETVVGEMRHIVILAEGNEENNFNAWEVEELDLVAREVTGNTNKKARNIQSDEEVMRESMGTQEEETGGYTSNDGSEESISRTKTEHLIHSYADAREIGDESGLDLFDERNTHVQFTSVEADDERKENFADENVDFVALPAFKRLPLAMDNGKAASKTKNNTKMPFREDTLDEERIWEKIGAMKTIVGFKTPSQPTCIGELKALYVFTGVETPASFQDDSDLDEANAKLKFLMSIVGVK